MYLIINILVITISLITVMVNIIKIIKLKISAKQRNDLFKKYLELSPLIFEIETRIKNGDFDNTPLVKEELISFMHLHDLCGNNFKGKKTTIKLMKLFQKRSDKAELWKQQFIGELNRVTDKKILFYLIQKIFFYEDVMKNRHPFRFVIFEVLYEIKKNNELQKMKDDDIYKNKKTSKSLIASVSYSVESNLKLA